MGFLPSPDGWKVTIFVSGNPNTSLFLLLFLQEKYRVGVEVRFVIGKALDSLLLRLPPLSL